MNDFEKKLIQLGFIPVDDGKFVNLIESVNQNGDNTRFVINVEHLHDSFYKYSENSYEDEKFKYFSYSFSSTQIDHNNPLTRLFGKIE
jgi:hypothetical protein